MYIRTIYNHNIIICRVTEYTYVTILDIVASLILELCFKLYHISKFMISCEKSALII